MCILLLVSIALVTTTGLTIAAATTTTRASPSTTSIVAAVLTSSLYQKLVGRVLHPLFLKACVMDKIFYGMLRSLEVAQAGFF